MEDLSSGKAQGVSIVRVAREWVGTPYRHQASCRLVGTDCLGLVRGIWRELIGPEPETVGTYSADWAEASTRENLLDGLSRHFRRLDVNDAKAGDILAFRMFPSAPVKHLGILSSDFDSVPSPLMIHAYSGLSVCETRLTAAWQRRIKAVFSFPHVECLNHWKSV